MIESLSDGRTTSSQRGISSGPGQGNLKPLGRFERLLWYGSVAIMCPPSIAQGYFPDGTASVSGGGAWRASVTGSPSEELRRLASEREVVLSPIEVGPGIRLGVLGGPGGQPDGLQVGSSDPTASGSAATRQPEATTTSAAGATPTRAAHQLAMLDVFHWQFPRVTGSPTSQWQGAGGDSNQLDWDVPVELATGSGSASGVPSDSAVASDLQGVRVIQADNGRSPGANHQVNLASGPTTSTSSTSLTRSLNTGHASVSVTRQLGLKSENLLHAIQQSLGITDSNRLGFGAPASPAAGPSRAEIGLGGRSELGHPSEVGMPGLDLDPTRIDTSTSSFNLPVTRSCTKELAETPTLRPPSARSTSSTIGQWARQREVVLHVQDFVGQTVSTGAGARESDVISCGSSSSPSRVRTRSTNSGDYHSTSSLTSRDQHVQPVPTPSTGTRTTPPRRASATCLFNLNRADLDQCGSEDPNRRTQTTSSTSTLDGSPPVKVRPRSGPVVRSASSASSHGSLIAGSQWPGTASRANRDPSPQAAGQSLRVGRTWSANSEPDVRRSQLQLERQVARSNSSLTTTGAGQRQVGGLDSEGFCLRLPSNVSGPDSDLKSREIVPPDSESQLVVDIGIIGNLKPQTSLSSHRLQVERRQSSPPGSPLASSSPLPVAAPTRTPTNREGLQALRQALAEHNRHSVPDSSVTVDGASTDNHGRAAPSGDLGHRTAASGGGIQVGPFFDSANGELLVSPLSWNNWNVTRSPALPMRSPVSHRPGPTRSLSGDASSTNPGRTASPTRSHWYRDNLMPRTDERIGRHVNTASEPVVAELSKPPSTNQEVAPSHEPATGLGMPNPALAGATGSSNIGSGSESAIDVLSEDSFFSTNEVRGSNWQLEGCVERLRETRGETPGTLRLVVCLPTRTCRFPVCGLFPSRSS